MSATEHRTLVRFAAMLRATTGIAGALLTVYVTLALFGYVRSSSQHYAAFTFAVMFMAGLISVRTTLERRAADPEWRWFPARLAIAVAGFVLAAAGGAYILWHAKRLEVAAPFFDNFDMGVGLAFTLGVLILTWLHWGSILTLVISASIAYFFYGHLLENHPKCQPAQAQSPEQEHRNYQESGTADPAALRV